MNTKPILFSTEMVQAILAGRKTQTRRTKGLEHINKKPNSYRYDGLDQSGDEGTEYIHYFELIDENQKPLEKYVSVTSPYKIGDILWVRESFNEVLINSKDAFIYKADWEEESIKYRWKPSIITQEIIYSFTEESIKFQWKPSIHMPKKACRLFLKISNVRAERLKEISENDAIAEGISRSGNLYFDYLRYVKELPIEPFYRELNPKMSFMTLWCKINGVDSWESNPWVWVIDFERIEKPENF